MIGIFARKNTSVFLKMTKKGRVVVKICVMGPVTTQTYYGGVAIFDEGLLDGFSQIGCEVVAYTEQDVEKSDFPVKKINWKNARRLFKEDKPDIVIASLQYAKYFFCAKVQAKKIYFLHGFFGAKNYGYIKSILAVIYQKWLIRMCDKVYSNSSFTAMVNDELFKIKTDKVVHIGIGKNIIEEVSGVKSWNKTAKTIFFAGRLVPAKGIEKVFDALKVLQAQGVGYKMIVAGTGPLEEQLRHTAKEYSLNVEFLGKVSQKEILHYYKMNEIFVSLNPSEPFGIVFAEALAFGCKVVCPCTGGQNEFLKDYPDRVQTLSSLEPDEIAEAIKFLFNKKIEEQRLGAAIEKFEYSNVARKLLEE